MGLGFPNTDGEFNEFLMLIVVFCHVLSLFDGFCNVYRRFWPAFEVQEARVPFKTLLLGDSLLSHRV